MVLATVVQKQSVDLGVKGAICRVLVCYESEDELAIRERGDGVTGRSGCSLWCAVEAVTMGLKPKLFSSPFLL